MTGAGGFVGASLARRLLAEGHDVHVLLRGGSDTWRLKDIRGALAVHEADLRNANAVCAAVRASAPDWIFHLAAHGAYSWQTDAQGIFESNALGTLHLLDACVRRGFDAFVHAGSSSEYGLKDHSPSEEEAPEPNSDYAVAKVAATMLCRQRAVRAWPAREHAATVLGLRAVGGSAPVDANARGTWHARRVPALGGPGNCARLRPRRRCV